MSEDDEIKMGPEEENKEEESKEEEINEEIEEVKTAEPEEKPETAEAAAPVTPGEELLLPQDTLLSAGKIGRAHV